MRKILIFVFFIFLISAFISCSDKSNTMPPSSNDSDKTEQTQDDDNILLDEDSTIDKNRPDENFSEPVAKNALYFDIKGLINSYEEFQTQDGTKGVGNFIFTFGDDIKKAEGDPLVYESSFPADYQIEELQNKKYIGISSYSEVIDQGTTGKGSKFWIFDYLNVGVPTYFLVGIQNSGENLAPHPRYMWANMMTLKSLQRTDGKTYFKYCYVSVPKYDSTESKIFLDSSQNRTFAPGENLFLWANIEMFDKVTVTPENEKELCIYTSESGDLTKEEYDEEISKDGSELECELPENYLTPQSEDSFLTFLFKGTINDLNESTDDVESGFGEFKAKVKGEDVDVDNYRSLAGVYTLSNGKDVIYIHSLAADEMISDKRYRFTVSETQISLDAILAFEEESCIVVNSDEDAGSVNGSNIFTQINRVEDFRDGDTYYDKTCVIAVPDFENSGSSVFVCKKDNEDFSGGENLQIAGNFVLLSDIEKIKELYNMESECYCRKDYNIIECSDFENIIGGE